MEKEFQELRMAATNIIIQPCLNLCRVDQDNALQR